MGIELIASVKVTATSDLYKIVDLLNKNLKYDDLMFGLAKDEDDPNLMVFTIYRT
ncbi:YpmA family protein [Tepidibacillus infernus]|uniref:YpmA family protein n=1 Tax=Tepidibacillus TaxID=1494427 RepID=UPI000837E33C|nr:YpmA family protein [Tepidibacillus decaturensis]